MKFENVDEGELDYAPCRYGVSRLSFRGPARNLTKPYVAFLGGTEIFGRFIAQPLPVLAERRLESPCVNFGCINAGIDAFVKDPTIMGACHDAQMTVVQIMGANSLSNRFYSVHPRRNDRFLSASTVLRAIYNDVDFSEFTFIRHMLSALFNRCPDRFDIVLAELREAWIARMRNMLGQVGPNTILLWLSREELSNNEWSVRVDPLLAEPLFVTRDMVDALTDLVLDVVIPDASVDPTTAGMHFPRTQLRAVTEMPGLACHAAAAEALLPILRKGGMLRT